MISPLSISTNSLKPMGSGLDIYVESLGNFRDNRGYAIQFLLPRLRDAGIRVRILDRPAAGNEARNAAGNRAEAAFLHIDLTELPEAYHGIRHQYPRTINGEALSIHRYLYSTLRLRPGEAHDGPVIVKTVLNSHGRPELRWRQYRNAWTRIAHASRKLVSPGFKQRQCPPYRVYRSIGEVPEADWQDERLMVEKFAFPTLDLPIVKHRCYFLFDTELNMKQVYDDILCASNKILSNEASNDPIPESVQAVRRRLKLDYGAIDYFLVDGDAVVVDVNMTSGASAEWLKRNAFRREFNDRVVARLIDFVRQ